MKKDGEKITVKFYLDYFSVDDKRELSVVKNGESVKVRINCGEAAGQTIFHVHVHLIPRYEGDVENPRGGVRAVIAAKKSYP